MSDATVAPSHLGRVLGIDGCRAGWVGIVLSPDPPDPAVVGVFGATFPEVVAAAGVVDVIGVDMSVHLSDSGARPCDLAARAFLRAKASSIFLTPTRRVLAAGSYAQACAVARSVDGKAISRQAWGLRTKILEIQDWLVTAGEPLFEVHPEVSFAALTGAPIRARKTSWAGLSARRTALAGEGIDVPADLGVAGTVAGADDVLDAAVVAWSARRIAAGTARSFPDPPVTLAAGRSQAIWA